MQRHFLYLESPGETSIGVTAEGELHLNQEPTTAEAFCEVLCDMAKRWAAIAPPLPPELEGAEAVHRDFSIVVPAKNPEPPAEPAEPVEALEPTT